MPVPNCEKEQQAIAEALSDADALIASLEKLIDKKEQFIQLKLFNQKLKEQNHLNEIGCLAS